MWIHRNDRLPIFNGAYTVFCTFGKGTVNESQSRSTAYWDKNLCAFVDSDCEDLAGIDECIEFWFDFNCVRNPYQSTIQRKKTAYLASDELDENFAVFENEQDVIDFCLCYPEFGWTEVEYNYRDRKEEAK